MEKLVVVIMGQNCGKFIGMCLESVKDADAIVYCDGGSGDDTLDICIDLGLKSEPTFMHELYPNQSGFHVVEDKEKLDRVKKEFKNYKKQIIYQDYNQSDPKMNGKQRNFYLDYVKKNYPDYWCLVLDADEVVEDLSKIKEFIQKCNTGIWSVRMRHFIGDLGHEDATQEKHYVLNRLFKVSEANKYPEVEHPILEPKKDIGYGWCDDTTIWHLAYIPNVWDFKKKYQNHLKKSNIHSPEFLKQWYYWHLFGTYPKKQFNPVEIPEIILNEFGVDKDELYFTNRGLELKHSLMVNQWNDFFKPTSVCDLGCGRGPYLFYWRWLLDKESVRGYEISQYAVDNSFTDSVMQGNITEYIGCNWDLVTCIDVLEHLDYEELDHVLNLLSDKENAKRILCSIPFLGDPNLDADPTHKIKQPKEWWIELFTDKGLKLIETPNHFLFREQILIFER
jgi:glycosyltransferase involved in cell wall biosynthesis